MRPRGIRDWLARAEPDLGPLEAAYRARFLPADVQQVRIFLPLYLGTMFLFALVDYQSYGWSPTLFLLTLVRCVVALVGLWLYRRLPGIRSARSLDRHLLLWGSLLYALSLFFTCVRSGHFNDTSVAVMLVLVTYMLLPNTLTYRMIPALLFTLAEIVLSLALPHGQNPSEVRTSILTLGFANAMGFILSIRLYTFRRNQFRAQHEEAQARAEIERLAVTDALTGVPNRRHFLQRAEAEFARSRRTASGFCLLYLDLDHFKTINDRHGHATGDEVLRRFAALVTGQVREMDVFGRLGGEEFGLLLPQTSLAQARDIAERLRRSCQDTQFAPQAEGLLVTLSAGLAEVSPDDTSIDDTLQRADRALYQAKALGRNRWELAGGPAHGQH